MESGGKPAGIPGAFARRIVELHGPAGAEWLANLPDLLRACAGQWSLRLERPFPSLSYNFVVPVSRLNGETAVLKLGVPGPELSREAEALQWMEGQGAIRLLAANVERGALLLERAQSGRSLESLCEQNDEAATRNAASVMRRLWRPLPPHHPFPSVQDWAADLRKARLEHERGGPLPVRLLDQAEELLQDLTRSMEGAVLLHGDLHHGNILSAEREPWLAIDPKGVAGEAAAEAGALIRNPMPQLLAWPDLPRVLERRVLQLAEELKLDQKRIHAWAWVQTVLSGVWMFEDHKRGWEPPFKVAEVLASFRT